MKLSLINEVIDIKKMMGLITEDMEVSSQASDLSKVQNLLNLEDLDLNVEDFLDDTEPICIAPKKLSEQENILVSKFWDWANSTGNKNNLKTVFNRLKTVIKDPEKNVEGISFGDMNFTKDQIDQLGKTLITIIVVGMVPKTSNCKKTNEKNI